MRKPTKKEKAEIRELSKKIPETVVETVVKGVKSFQKVNHYKRLLKCFESGGVPALQDYSDWVRDNNRKISKKYTLEERLGIK